MSLAVLFKSQSTGTLALGGTLIPKNTYQALRLADDVVQQAQAVAAQLHEKTTAAAQQQMQQAQAQGFAAGQALGLAQVLGTLQAEHQLRQLLSHRLADLVEQCTRSLLGEFTSAELLRQRVLHLLRAANSGNTRNTNNPLSGATLRVCPEQFTQAKEVVSALVQTNTLNVVADERQAYDALLLETKVGFVHSNLELSLLETRNLVRQALAQALQFLGGDAALNNGVNS
jgi:type III secretion system HrpE/YscL family protein